MRIAVIVIGAAALLTGLPAAAAPRHGGPRVQTSSAAVQPMRARRQPLMERADAHGMVTAVISERELSRAASNPKP
jgi:hypothetical protein